MRYAGQALARGTLKVIQFDHAPADPEVLRQVNSLCTQFGAKVQVRFYGFYKSKFDARIVEQIPDVVSLSVDCLKEIGYVEALADLPKLQELTFGVFEFDCPDFLRLFNLGQLNDLKLLESRKRNFDLSPLESCNRLEALFVNTHWKGIETIAALPMLSSVTLSGFPNRSALDFLNGSASLRQLKLLLGSRESILELCNENLERLHICWVRGLNDVGSIARFPELSELSLEDQIRLDRIDVTGARLERLRLVNCKTLSKIEGLETLDNLRELLVSKTTLDLEMLANRKWAPSLEALALYSTSNRWNDATKAALALKGFSQSGNLWLWP